MSSNPRKSRNPHRTGLIFVMSVLALGWVLSTVPDWFRPATLPYTCRVPMGTGAAGIVPGSPVLIGGLQRGRVNAVRTVLDLESNTPSHISIDFEFDRSIPLHPEAVIRKYVGVSGTDGVLNIIHLGNPDRAWPSEHHWLPLAETGSGTEALLGEQTSLAITAIQAAASRLSERGAHDVQEALQPARDLAPLIRDLRDRLGPDVNEWRTRGRSLQTDGDTILQRSREIMAEVESTRQWQERVTDIVQWFRGDGGEGANKVDDPSDSSRNDRVPLPVQIRELTDRASTVANEAKAAIQSGEDVVSRIREIVPETTDTFRRISARSSLAGGQLKLLLDSLLTTGITAIMYRPNHDSLSREQLLESVQNTLFAARSLQQAAAQLDTITTRNPEAMRSNPGLAELLSEPMEDRITDLNRRLQSLYELMVRIAP